MRSTSGIEWEIRGILPRDLRRVCLWSVAFYMTVGAAMLFVAWGVSLLGDPHSIAPYVMILVATAIAFLFGGFIWDGAGGAVTIAQNESPDNADDKAPAHRQKWTYQELRHQWIVPLFVAVIWHGVGIGALTHYIASTWPTIASGLWLFVSYELMGLIPVAVAARSLRRGRPT